MHYENNYQAASGSLQISGRIDAFLITACGVCFEDEFSNLMASFGLADRTPEESCLMYSGVVPASLIASSRAHICFLVAFSHSFTFMTKRLAPCILLRKKII